MDRIRKRRRIGGDRMSKINKIVELEEAIALADSGNIRIDKDLFSSETDWQRIKDKVIKNLNGEKKYIENKLKDELYKKARRNNENTKS